MSSAPAAAAASSLSLLGRKRKNEDVEPITNKAAAKANYYCDNKWTQRCNVYIESEHDAKEEKPVLYSNKPECDQACQRPGGLLNDLWRTVFEYEPNLILQPAFDIKAGERLLNLSYTSDQLQAQAELQNWLVAWKSLVSQHKIVGTTAAGTVAVLDKITAQLGMIGPALTVRQAEFILAMYPSMEYMLRSIKREGEFFSAFIALVETAKPTFIMRPGSLYIFFRNFLQINEGRGQYLATLYLRLQEQQNQPSIDECVNELKDHINEIYQLNERNKSIRSLANQWAANHMFAEAVGRFPWNFSFALLQLLFGNISTFPVKLNNLIRELLYHYSKPTYEQGRLVFILFDETSALHGTTNMEVARHALTQAQRQLLLAAATQNAPITQINNYIATNNEVHWIGYRQDRDRIEIDWLRKIRPESEPKTQALIDLRLVELDRKPKTAGMAVANRKKPKLLHQLF